MANMLLPPEISKQSQTENTNVPTDSKQIEEGKALHYKPIPILMLHMHKLMLTCIDMDVDQPTGSSGYADKSKRGEKRIQKRGRDKAKAAMVFPVYKKGRKIGPRLSARQKRNSLRP